jgi:hypothetical protein
MPNIANIGGAKNKMAPLISFNTIFDIDYGLVRLIYEEYLDKSVFEEEFFNQSPREIISKLYYRKEENPLYLFSKENIEKKLLDQYYEEFKDQCMDKILDKSISTEIINLIKLFNQSLDVIPTILYYNPIQKDIILDEPILKNNQVISISSIEKDRKILDLYTQFYFKYIEESELFMSSRSKTFYFSNHGCNLNQDNSDIKDSDIINTIAINRNAINIFNIYDEKIIIK